MFKVIFYTFNKKVNSTKRPTDSTSKTEFQVVAKDNLDMMRPVLGLNLATGNAPETRNYAYIPEFGRYYFVDKWECERGIWYAFLSIDVMATYKTQIGANTSYVLRSASESDGTIVDEMYPASTVTTTIRDDAYMSPWANTINGGMFVIGILGTSTTYYIMTPQIMGAFLEFLFSDGYLDALIGDWSNIYPELKAQANPLQYITSIMWTPYPTTQGTAVTTIKVGYVYVAVPTAWRIDGSSLIFYSHSLNLKRHPQASTRGSYLNQAPYSSYTLFYPPWGQLQMDADIIANSTKITCNWYMDLRTGKGTIRVTGGTNDEYIVAMANAQIMIPYQVSQVMNTGFSVGQLLQPVTSLLTGNYLGAIGSGASAIGNAIAGKIPSAKSVGNDGGMNALAGVPGIYYEFKRVVDEDREYRGRPLCKMKRLNTLSGYILVADANLSISGATRNEITEINNYLEGGFFYE